MLMFLLACDLNAERGEADKADDSALQEDTAACTQPSTWFGDADADGFGATLFTVNACEQPEGYVADATDCDDTEPSVSPDSPEYCDGVDQNCNGEIDEGAAVDAPNWYADTDADGFGDAAESVAACIAPTGFVQLATDCDDATATTYPSAAEYCNGEDDNCDGETDEPSALDALTWYADTDADGFGDPDVTTPACEEPTGYTDDNNDCDDARADANPAAPEVCNGLDDDCDAFADDNPTNPSTWYFDADADGYGRSSTTIVACGQPVAYAATGDDCDDVDPELHPGAAEYCDEVDTDCDGQVAEDDSVDALPWYADLDGDGFGDPAGLRSACEMPEDYVADDSDCDDADAGVFVGAVEVCNAKDDDCEGTIDEGAVDAAEWFVDSDGDGFGVDGAGSVACDAPVGTVDASGDCDDTTWAIHPAMVETCSDLADLNCDGAIGGEDNDGDGVKACEDCDDIDASAFPGAAEVCNAKDDDCDGDVDGTATDRVGWYADWDGDGYGDSSNETLACERPGGLVSDSNDCDDLDGGVNPGAAETCDGVDNDCSGLEDDNAVDAFTWYADADGDGFGDPLTTDEGCELPFGYAADNTDCDDAQSGVNPGGVETCNTTEDDDCNGSNNEVGADSCVAYYFDGDKDGAGVISDAQCMCVASGGYEVTGVTAANDDCDDLLAEINPGEPEVCDDGTDQDCDGADLECPFGDYTTDWGSEMVAISAGSFTMGGGAADPDGAYTDHVVTLTRDFWIAETEITRGQWESYSANATWTYSSISQGNPCTTSTSTDDCPADTISWYHVAKYANALSAQEGLTACYLADGTDLAAAYLSDPYACPGYRMPTEAEWEYAARAGQDTEFSGSNTANSVAWYSDNAYSLGTFAHQVATKAPNAWGLHDMSGNVWEWTNDWYDGSYGGYGSGASQTDPPGPTSSSYRVFRGGYWNNETFNVRAAVRNYVNPDVASNGIGARLARSNP